MIVLEGKGAVRWAIGAFVIMSLWGVVVAVGILGFRQQQQRFNRILVDGNLALHQKLLEIQESRVNCEGVVPSITNHNPKSVYITLDKAAVDVIIETIEEKKPVKKKKRKKK